MECSLFRPLLEAYLDGELERSDACALESHVDGCADCRAALGRLDTLRRALREAAPRFAAPPALRERIAAAAHASDAQARSAAAPGRRSALARPGVRFAAACVLACAAGAFGGGAWQAAHQHRVAAGALLAHDLFASHWRALAAASPVDVISTDRHTVKPWFAGKVAQSPPVRDFAAAGFALVGGRIDYVGGERVPVLVYRHGAHLIDVFAIPADAAALDARTRARGYWLVNLTQDGQRLAIVADADEQELARFAALLASP